MISLSAIARLPPELNDRLEQGDPQAIEEVLKLPRQDAIRELGNKFILYTRTTKRRDYPGYREKLLDALRTVEGHATLIGEQIEKLSDQPVSGRDRSTLFMVLGELATDEAKTVAGSFIEDKRYQESEQHFLDGGYEGRNYILAIKALGHMELPDAPIKDKNPRYYTPADRKIWQQWWREREEEKAAAAAGHPPPGHAPPVHSSPEAQVAATDAPANSGWPLKWFVAIAFAAILLVATIVCRRQLRKPG